MPKSKKKKESGRLELEQQKLANQALQDDLKLRMQVFKSIEPFAKALISMGLDPAAILSTPLGVSLLAPGRTAIGKEFEAARSALIDTLGSSGLSTGSGVGVGPLANLFGEEAQQQASLVQGLPLQSLQLGLQGANLLQGQQAIFNPQITGGIASQSAANVINQPEGPGVQIATAAAGGLGAALSGFGQPRPKTT
jgi:hypothetical protein